MASARILIIDDDQTLSDQLSHLLHNKGFSINQCHDGEKGLQTALSKSFDLILLDVLLPTLNGFSLLTRLRQSRQTPVMMLTACGAEAERIEGYSQGADDYLPKPFNFQELLVRIDALLRRTRGFNTCTTQSTRLIADQLQLDKTTRQATYGEHSLALTPLQFRLLWVLVENRHEILSKPYLYQTVMEKAYSRYDRGLDMHLSRVRRKLVEAGMAPERLTTVHGQGYRFD